METEKPCTTIQLSSGVRFCVDTDDIDKVLARTWYLNKDGYLQSSKRHEKTIVLHRYLLGVEDPALIVDHVNRDRCDCRRANLRIISTQGNSANHSRFRTNKSGYTGVYYSKCAKRYEVKVGWRGKRIMLGSSKQDLTLLAQMYNVAAKYLYGENVGQLNDVPEPTQALTRVVIEKCKPYIAA